MLNWKYVMIKSLTVYCTVYGNKEVFWFWWNCCTIIGHRQWQIYGRLRLSFFNHRQVSTFNSTSCV